MATPEQKAELKRKVKKLVDDKFDGDYRKAFKHYAHVKTKDDTVNRDEVMALLSDAGVGSFVTRGMWADGVMEELDKDQNGKITFPEFEKVLNARKG